MDDTWNTKCVSLNAMYESDKLDYDKKDIMRSVLKLNECGFIRIEAKSPSSKPYLNSCTIEDVTFASYQFAESIREPSIWDKTKSIANKVGNHTLGFIESVAHDVAVEAGKEAVKIVMWKNS